MGDKSRRLNVNKSWPSRHSPQGNDVDQDQPSSFRPLCRKRNEQQLKEPFFFPLFDLCLQLKINTNKLAYHKVVSVIPFLGTDCLFSAAKFIVPYLWIK